MINETTRKWCKEQVFIPDIYGTGNTGRTASCCLEDGHKTLHYSPAIQATASGEEYPVDGWTSLVPPRVWARTSPGQTPDFRTDLCPVCDGSLEPELVMNSLSRYTDAYICNGCGNREAFEGDFWHGSEARRADERAKTNIRILRLMDQ